LRFWSPTPHKTAPVATTTNATPTTVSNEPEPNPYDFLAAFGNNVSSSTSAPGYQAQATSNSDQLNTGLDINPANTTSPQPGDVVSPQMLLKYFNKSTNGTGAGIIAPVDVNTSRPTQATPSSATYSN
jgi:hypothetical protein